MKAMVLGVDVSSLWTKVLLFISLGKAFVAGAGLGLAALGIVDVASTLGVRHLVDFIEHEHVLDAFALGGGTISIIYQLVWKLLGR